MAQRKRQFKLRNPFVGEMLGKDDQIRNGYGTIKTLWNSFFNHKTTIDYTRNNYDFLRAVYYASQIGDIEPSMLLGSAFAKPIVNSTAAFSLGSGFKVDLAGSDENGVLQDIENDINKWIETNFDKIYDWAGKYGTRDGDGYMFIDEVGNLSMLRPETVEVVVNSLTGDLLGYNVTEQVKETHPTNGQSVEYTYLKQYRSNLVRITKIERGQDQQTGTIIYERIFSNGQDIDSQAKDESGSPLDIQLLPEELDNRPLPIVHFRNEPEPGALYGNSELQNVLVFMRNYGEVLDEATKREVYNSKPVLVISGVGNPEDDEANADAYVTDPKTGEKTLDWQQRTTLYLEDPQASAKFMEIPNSMEQTGKLLEYLFYCIVQASETPEFVFGTAVSSSRASVSEQMPIVAMKAERKRKQMRGPLLDLVNLYIFRQLQLSNPTYFPLDGIAAEFEINFPAVVDEDKKLNADIVKLLLENGVIGNVKSLEILLGMSSDDAEDEVLKAIADAEARTAAAGGVIDDSARLNKELGTGDGA